jgi:hypothetical protein
MQANGGLAIRVTPLSAAKAQAKGVKFDFRAFEDIGHLE